MVIVQSTGSYYKSTIVITCWPVYRTSTNWIYYLQILIDALPICSCSVHNIDYYINHSLNINKGPSNYDVRQNLGFSDHPSPCPGVSAFSKPSPLLTYVRIFQLLQLTKSSWKTVSLVFAQSFRSHPYYASLQFKPPKSQPCSTGEHSKIDSQKYKVEISEGQYPCQKYLKEWDLVNFNIVSFSPTFALFLTEFPDVWSFRNHPLPLSEIPKPPHPIYAGRPK